MADIQRYDAVFAEAVFTFIEVCRQRGYAPELILRAGLGRVPGAYTGEAGFGVALRLQQTDELHALAEDGKLYRATRTWRLMRQPLWLQKMAETSFLVATAEAHIEESPQLRREIMNSLLLWLTSESKRTGPPPAPDS
ncbi:hypothetical protein [Arthrobacter sp. W4I7]|uniref:hypothetical protein n=1 Tax=Arthrobacter sp. W4I7 TaxID=3042296 RepID=UPI0027836083|nr:hypothetical protein [Arthrobacter sp. W4I7]MDQ0690946.1 hypothetical protein [Arthrobacter sp. W4I7]